MEPKNKVDMAWIISTKRFHAKSGFGGLNLAFLHLVEVRQIIIIYPKFGLVYMDLLKTCVFFCACVF